jgi:anti-sigma regulatory factor (Ser/Thr protein kinase)
VTRGATSDGAGRAGRARDDVLDGGGVSADALTLPAALQSVRRARAFVREHCVREALPGGLCDDAVLLTSELVSNAVLHGRSEVELRVGRRGRCLHVSVHDENSRHPAQVRDDPNALDGRGLALVAAMSTAWGVHDDPTGKAVWFELSLP